MAAWVLLCALLSALNAAFRAENLEFVEDVLFAGLRPKTLAGEFPDVSAVECAKACAEDASCSSFFRLDLENKNGAKCQPVSTIYVEQEALVREADKVHKYYRIYTAGKCPMKKCFYRSRNHDFCVTMFELNTKMDKAQSSALCKQKGGHLVEPDTTKQSQWISNMIRLNSVNPLPLTAQMYLGATKIVGDDKTFLWSTGGQNVSYPNGNWRTGEPNGGQTGICLINHLDPQNPGWDDKDCTTLVDYVVCQYNTA